MLTKEARAEPIDQTVMEYRGFEIVRNRFRTPRYSRVVRYFVRGCPVAVPNKFYVFAEARHAIDAYLSTDSGTTGTQT